MKRLRVCEIILSTAMWKDIEKGVSYNSKIKLKFCGIQCAVGNKALHMIQELDFK